MAGLRSTQYLNFYAGVFCLFIFLFFSFSLPAEEPFPASGLDAEEPSPASGLDVEEPTTAPGLDVEALKRGITEEAPGELINLSLSDSSVSLRIAGRWKGTLEGGWGMAFSPLGNSAISGENPFFTQEGELTLSLWLNNRWFMEASFMDDSKLNTYRVGYQGHEGDIIRYVGVGNTGLDFPVFPYLDLGGDSPSSFGAYGNFGAGNLSLHTLVRYDAAAREERIFVGNRERNYSYSDLSRPERGVSFVLPDDNLPAIPEVYIQDNKGSLRDSEGRRWRLAEPSEYGASARFGLVELTLGRYTDGITEPEGMIAVAYTRAGSNTPWNLSLGAYGSPGTGFLGDVQDWFGRDISSLPQCGGNNPVPWQTNIVNTGTPVLIIYEPGTFSPFEKQNRYLAPVNTSTQAALVTLSTGVTITQYEVIPLEDNYLDTAIVNPEQAFIRRGIYELVSGGARDLRSPEERWPLGAEYPDLYLPGRTIFTEDVGLRFTNYSAAGAYSIGTDVVPGSVQVYRNGILDPYFTYNPSGGTVNLGNPAGFSEVIRITYLKQSSERRLGSLAAGIGAIWDPDGPFSGKLGLGLRWNVTSGAYTENDATSPGTVGLGAEAKWDFDHLKAGLTLGLGFEQPDTTGLYRVTGMEGNDTILSLPPGLSFISETPYSLISTGTRADLVYRNYKETSFLGTSSLSDINSGAPVVSGESGPYPAADSAFSSQVLVAEFEFSSGQTWTGFQTPLGVNGEFLEQAGKIEVPFRFINFRGNDPLNDAISVILQIGALADKDTGNPENPNLIIDIPLYSGSINAPGFNNPDIISYTLSDEDKAKLQNAEYLRLLVERTGGTGNLGGRVVLAPPIAWGTAWRPVTVTGSEIKPARDIGGGGPVVNAYEVMETGPDKLESRYPDIIKRLHSENSRQRILELSWKDFSSAGLFSDAGPGVDKRIPVLPLSSYRSLSFFVRRPKAENYSGEADENHPAYYSSDQYKIDQGTFHFIIANGPHSLQRREEIMLEAKIPLDAFKEVEPGTWTRVDILYRGGNPRIVVGGKTVSGYTPEFRNTAHSEWDSSYAAFLLVPGTDPFPEASMAMDEIFCEDPVPSYKLNTGASLEWNKSGAVLKIREKEVVSDLSFLTALESASEGNPFEEKSDGSFGINSRSQAGMTLLGAKLTGKYAFSLNNAQRTKTDYSWSAGHSISKTFGAFTARESFDDAPADETMNHRVNLALETRVNGTLYGETVYENERLRRSWQAGTSGKPAEKVPLFFALDAQAGINERNTAGWPYLSNYAEAWFKSFADLLPDSGRGKEGRDARGSFRARLETSPVGSELFFQGNTVFSKPRETFFTASLARLDFPINPEGSDLRFLFRTEREYRRDISGTSRDFREDGAIWGGGMKDALPLMFAIPFYSLFDSRMEERMDEFAFSPSGRIGQGASINSSQFQDRYEFSVQKAMNYGLSSLFVPYSSAFRVSRILERRLDTPRDAVNLGLALGFSSVNLFGAMGAAPVFDFYQGDEISHSVETLLNFPKGEDVYWSVRANQSLLFHGFSGAEMVVSNILTVNSGSRPKESSRWTESLNIEWLVPMEKTLLGTVYSAFMRMAKGQRSWLTLANLAESQPELLRNESLEFTFEKIPNILDEDYIRFSVTLGHESIVRIFGHLNLSVYGKLKISEDLNARIFSFLGIIGASLNLMF